ncbi:MAG: hypothetical protein WCT39_06155, partial [Candidatus Margulisiibacteriota bacterium]
TLAGQDGADPITQEGTSEDQMTTADSRTVGGNDAHYVVIELNSQSLEAPPPSGVSWDFMARSFVTLRTVDGTNAVFRMRETLNQMLEQEEGRRVLESYGVNIQGLSLTVLSQFDPISAFRENGVEVVDLPFSDRTTIRGHNFDEYQWPATTARNTRGEIRGFMVAARIHPQDHLSSYYLGLPGTNENVALVPLSIGENAFPSETSGYQTYRINIDGEELSAFTPHPSPGEETSLSDPNSEQGLLVRIENGRAIRITRLTVDTFTDVHLPAEYFRAREPQHSALRRQILADRDLYQMTIARNAFGETRGYFVYDYTEAYEFYNLSGNRTVESFPVISTDGQNFVDVFGNGLMTDVSPRNRQDDEFYGARIEGNRLVEIVRFTR